MKDVRWSRDARTVLHDAAAAALLAAMSLLPLVWLNDLTYLSHAGLWCLLMSSAVALRRIAPVLGIGVITVAGIGLILSTSVPLPCLLAIPIVVYGVGRYRRLSGLVPVIAFGVAASIAGPLSWTASIDVRYRFLATSVLVLLCASIVALAYLSGRYMRERILNATLDREIVSERFTAAQRQSEQESQLATGRARAEIAQELHDVLAHSLSVIVVQAEGAKAMTAKRPEIAAQALTVIADTGRKSIGEVRRIVSLMRGDSDSPHFGPAPSLTQIPALIDASGDRISLTIAGDTPVVPESLGLTTYRIVQEATTNFLKHAGPTATATVAVAYLPDEITLRITDDGMGSLSQPDGHGSGLAGMRERVATMGGSLEAGPRVGGGYEVKAQLPLPSRLGKSWLKEASK